MGLRGPIPKRSNQRRRRTATNVERVTVRYCPVCQYPVKWSWEDGRIDTRPCRCPRGKSPRP